MVQTYTLRIKNGTRHVKQYRIWLWWKKYTCIKRANGRVYYEKKECSRREKNHMQRFSRRKGLTFEAVPTQYTRSNSYRSQFFACHPSATGKYRCAYCGKKKPKDKKAPKIKEEKQSGSRRPWFFGTHHQQQPD